MLLLQEAILSGSPSNETMNISIPVSDGLKLTIAKGEKAKTPYATSKLQRGWLLSYRGTDLSEEAVGFGVPVAKCGLQAIFPGTVELGVAQKDPYYVVDAIYELNLVEKIRPQNGGPVENPFIYRLKDRLAASIRNITFLRAPLTNISSILRRAFHWETAYEPAGFNLQVRLVYTVDPGRHSLQVESVVSGALGGAVTELALMNEQGAHFFDCYRDSTGLSLTGKRIGCWDEVTAVQGWFESTSKRVSFTAPQEAGSRLYRGRELVGSRLAWAGFGYILSSPRESFSYTIQFKENT